MANMISDGTPKRINLLKPFCFVACKGQLQVVLWQGFVDCFCDFDLVGAFAWRVRIVLCRSCWFL